MDKSEKIFEYMMKKLEQAGALKDTMSCSILYCGNCRDEFKKEVCQQINVILKHGN